MKILHIGKYFSPFSGGLENYMRDAMVALARRGIASIALVHRHSLSFRTTDETFTASGQQFHVIRTGLWARLLYTPISPLFPWHLRRIIKTTNPDILHLHMPNPSAFWALVLPSARRVPWVVHWHSDVITSTQGGVMKAVYKLYQPFEHAVLKRAKAVIATSPPYLESSQPLEKWRAKCRVIPLGVDTERYSTTHERDLAVGARPDLQGWRKCRGLSGTIPARRDLFSDSEGLRSNRSEDAPTKQPLRVLAVGRLTYYKGFRYLIEAAARAPNTHINLVGVGEEAGQLKALVASLELQDSVTFHGFLSDAELAKQMAKCDCLCLPSIERTEAFGMILLEAMYFGKATVASDVPGSGMGWVVDHGVTGIKVKPADAKALAIALEQLASNREELDRMGRRGKEKFAQQFEITRAVAGLNETYQCVMNEYNADWNEKDSDVN